MERIGAQLGYDGSFVVDCVGHSGRIALFWKNQQGVKLISYSRNRIDVEVRLDDMVAWRLTGYDGMPERNWRRESWNLLRKLANLSILPWCCIGDFNDLMYGSEKRGFVLHPNWLLEGFRSAVHDSGLTDLGMIGYSFTWERSRGSTSWVEDRLDRALVILNGSPISTALRCGIWVLPLLIICPF